MSVLHYITLTSTSPVSSGLGQYNYTIGLDLSFDSSIAMDDDISLARAVTVALNTDRRALPDDILPDDRNPDRHGWWGDLGAADIWNGWPIGTRFWLMSRDKLTDSNSKEGSALARCQTYISEALQPFVDNEICSTFTVQLAQEDNDKITGMITLYRGPKTAIALQYQSIWMPYS